jgi:hypothetical protein
LLELKNFTQLLIFLDNDIYLPKETVSYCQAVLANGGFPMVIEYEDKMPDERKSHYVMYRFLQAHLIKHIQRGNLQPTLSLLLKPREVLRRKNIENSCKTEFLGENEADVTDNERTDWEDSDSE